MNRYKIIASISLSIGLVVSLMMPLTLLAQDAQFTQFFAAPLYHNPAFTGTAFKNRVAFNYRNQYPQIGGNFVTLNAAYDTYLENRKSGVGVYINRDVAGVSNLTSTGVHFSYAYHLEMAKNKNLSFGASVGLVQRNVNFFNLTFADAIRSNSATQETFGDGNSVFYPDIALGALYYGGNLFGGFSVHHINRPIQNTLSNTDDRLPIRYTLTGGYRFRVSRVPSSPTDDIDDIFFIPNAQLRVQGTFSTLDVGAGLQFNNFILGGYYRGLPIMGTENGILNQDALAVLAGVNFYNFSFGYSYDYHISRLSGLGNGSHEISFIYTWDKTKGKKKYRSLPCPSF